MTYDEILSALLTDMANTPVKQADGTYTQPNTSKGSILYVVAVAVAACVWGLYKLKDWAIRQMFFATADDDFKVRHAVDIGLTPLAGETMSELGRRYYIKRRNQQNTFNAEQYRLLALSVEGVKDAWVIPQGQGVGTIVVIVTAKTSNEVPSQALLDTVYNMLANPATAHAWAGRFIVRAPAFIRLGIEVTATTTEPQTAAGAMRGFVDSLQIGISITKQDIAAVLTTLGIMQPVIRFIVSGAYVEAVSAGAVDLIRAANISVNGVNYA